MFKWVFSCLAGMGLVSAMCFFSYQYGRSESYTSGPTIEKIEKMAHLVTLKVNASDAVHEEWRNLVDTVAVVYVAKGDALIGFDLRKAKLLSKDEKLKEAVIQLPQPDVISPRVDVEKSRVVWSEHSWVWDKSYDACVKKAQERAQKGIAAVTGCPENLDVARQVASQLLISFWEELGWKVEVRFE